LKDVQRTGKECNRFQLILVLRTTGERGGGPNIVTKSSQHERIAGAIPSRMSEEGLSRTNVSSLLSKEKRPYKRTNTLSGQGETDCNPFPKRGETDGESDRIGREKHGQKFVLGRRGGQLILGKIREKISCKDQEVTSEIRRVTRKAKYRGDIPNGNPRAEDPTLE